ncbi:MAG: pyroglutamyl-peptidase I [Clostridia bacterium]|nr:pyroglutamyl-peptidase I [Clostridia bacterium]
MKILLTGFEPFGTRAVNTSFEAVLRMKDTEDHNIRKVCLPVTWGGAVKKLYQEIDAFDPDAVVMFGLASGAEAIRVERVGINLRGSIKDNDGVYPCGCMPGESKIANGENAYFSTFDFEKILTKLKEEEIPAAYSFSAGTYICNLVLYSALKKDKDEGANRITGFIHVPDATEFVGDNAKSLPLDVIVRAVETAVYNCY